MPQAEPSVLRPHALRVLEARGPPSPTAKDVARGRPRPTRRGHLSGRPSGMPRVAPLEPPRPAHRVRVASGRRSRTGRGGVLDQQPLRPAEIQSAQPPEMRRVGRLGRRRRGGEVESVVPEEYRELQRRLQKNLFPMILEEVPLIGVEGAHLDFTCGRYSHPVKGFPVRDR